MEIKEKRLTFSEFIKRGHFLYFSYYAVYTAYMDHKIAGRSLKGFVCNKGDEIYPVQSMTYRVLRCLEREIDIKRSDVLVDVGCGWGRALGFLREKGLSGKAMYGIEINRSAAAFTKRVFRGCKNVRIICGDAVKTVIPSATVFFMFNPFGGGVMRSFLDMIEENYKAGVRVYYVRAVNEGVFRQRADRWKLKKRVYLKPRHHVPVVLCEYEYTGKADG